MASPADAGPGAAAAALEVERKYDVESTTAVPDLTGLPGVDSVSAAAEYALEAVYFDTDDLRLRATGITLRNRTGGEDAGWHLKLPAGRDREELAVNAPPDEVPEALAALIRAHLRGRELAPVASLSTRRVVRRLLRTDGAVLAELADDTVTGRPLSTGVELRWREWEVELAAGERHLLDSVEERLLAAGAAPSSSSSKLGRVLPRPHSGPPPRPGKASDGQEAGAGTAAAAVQQHLAEQVAELVARDPQARRDLPDGLHKMRVATRRLRSALATFRPLLDREKTDPLRDELRWLAGVLGAARDAEVMHARLRRLVAAEPDDLVLGPVQDRIDKAMTRRHRDAHDIVLTELDSERYLRLLDRLDELVADPPFLPDAYGSAEDVLRHLVHRTWRRLRRAMKAAHEAPRGAQKEDLLHEVRKDAKRSRYAAEAVVPVFGQPARQYAAAVEELQEALGDFQDGVVTRAVLRELAAAGHAAGESGFTLGRLHALEQSRAERALDRWPEARAAVSRKHLRGWLQEPRA